MKITRVSKLKKDDSGGYTIPIVIGKGPSSRKVEINFDPKEREAGLTKPISLSEMHQNWWLFKDNVLFIDGVLNTLDDEETLKVKHFVLKEEKILERISKEVEAFERMSETARREKISDSVKLFVWQRDQGKCVICGNKEKLEFDHIIPVIEGGANTERNIQILCENCNRSKGRKI
jgi:hypothetical protein